ncbi:RecF/RecN/SMC protein [Entophlyctis helioformis]|nr:RecF/RecN/SMC protein [Entophlyctis helioformis]
MITALDAEAAEQRELQQQQHREQSRGDRARSSTGSPASSRSGSHSGSGSSERPAGSSQQQQQPSQPARPAVRLSSSQAAADDEPAVPRLVISKIVQHNFKSYAGKVEIGPFHKSFTSVVGPNGSGKSNVIDSLLFVFGFKAKKMRQGKLSDLIHNSSAFPDLHSCSVEVHFQEIIDLPGPDAFQVVPNSQLTVSRSVERSHGEKKTEKSYYSINGRMSNYTEVTQLLKGKGIDLDHKRFLILQGEVESIALMKPKAQTEHEDGLLEYLEDIIGTTHYKEAIEEAGKQLEECSQEREEKLQRLKIIQNEKAALEEKKQEALEYIETENQIAFYRNQLLLRDITVGEKSVLEMEAELAAVKKARQDEDKAFEAQTSEVEALEKSFKQCQAECKQLEMEAKDAKADLQKFDRAEIEMKEKEKYQRLKLKKVAKALEQDKHKMSEDETWISNFAADVQKAETELQGLESRLEAEQAELETIRQSLQGKTEVFQQQIEEQQHLLAPWTEKINATRTQINVARAELELLASKMSEGKRVFEAAQAAVSGLQQTLGSKQSEVRDIQQHAAVAQANAAASEAKLERARMDHDAAKAALDAARQKYDEMGRALQALQTRGKIHSSLMHETSSGRIPGICGRLGDLGIIDDKYDVAITTACGALDSILVETVETAQQCIDHLRKNNLGKATFICLNKLRSENMSRIRTPENVPRLFDLVKPAEDRFAPAFYQALTDTLVAENMEQANRIAYGKQRFRVVTLQGQLVDKSGTMTGGGSRPQRGGMSSKFARADAKEVSPAKLEECKHARDAAADAVHNASVLVAKLERQLADDQRAVQELEVLQSKLAIDVGSLKSQYADAEEHFDSSKNIQGPDPADAKRADELERLLEKLEPVLGKQEAAAAAIQAKIAALQEKILEIGGVKLRSQNAKVDGIKEQIHDMHAKVTRLRAEKRTREVSLGKMAKSIARLEVETAEIHEALEQLQTVFETQSQAASTVRKRVKEAQAFLDSKQEEFEKMKATRDEQSAALNSSRSKQLELKTRQAELGQKVSARQRHIRAAKDSLAKLQLQLTGLEGPDDLTQLPVYTPEELDELDFEQGAAELSALESHLKKLRPNMGVINEFRQKMELYMSRTADLTAITEKRDEIKERFDELRKNRLREFMAGFTAISLKLKEMYQLITMGGNAELELVDSLDPFSEGVLFSVMPPKKSWKNIANLSGGEKTLSSLALVFALHHFKPTPLYVMDEIDAALDYRNVSIVANYIKQRTKNAQFVIISLRNNMFELADRLVGVYKTNDASKSVTIDPRGIQLHAVSATQAPTARPPPRAVPLSQA